VSERTKEIDEIEQQINSQNTDLNQPTASRYQAVKRQEENVIRKGDETTSKAREKS
jgi:hypothetical protein